MEDIKIINQKIVNEFLEDRNKILDVFKTIYGNPSFIEKRDRKCFRWHHPPANVFNDVEENLKYVMLAYKDEIRNMELSITWIWSKGKDLEQLINDPATIGRIAAKAISEEPTQIVKRFKKEDWYFYNKGTMTNLLYHLKFKRGWFNKKLMVRNITYFKSYHHFELTAKNN